MSVEQVVDAYLQMAQHLLGDPLAAPAAPSLPAEAAALPHPDWLGDAASAAVSVGTALTQSRLQLNSAAGNLSTATTSAAQIGRDATLQLQGIINDWGAAKATAASTPQPLRDSALITAGQQHIAEAMALISATSARYAAAATALHAATSTLPSTAKPHADGGNPTPAGPPVGEDPAPAADAADTPQSALTALDLSSDAGPAADETPASPAMMSALPAAMGGTQNAAPAMAAPMNSMLPAAASPLSSLGGLANQFGSTPATPAGAADFSATGQTPSQSTPRSVDAAIDAALDALGITDPAARARWHSGYDTLIHRESAGNPHSVNRWDSNARGPIQSDGAPAGSSRGLTQMTPATFQRYRLPALSTDIYDPVSNIAASMRYVMEVHRVDPSGINLAANVQQANQRAQGGGY